MCDICDNVKADCTCRPERSYRRSPNLTDVGNAERLVEHMAGDYLYVAPWATWITFDGQRWSIDTKATVVERAKEVARNLHVGALELADSSERKQTVKWAMQTEGVARVEAMVKLARSVPGIPIDPDELDQHRHLLVVNNGTLDLRTGKLGPHRREHLATKMAPVDYDPEAVAPVWEAFLEQVILNAAVRGFLQRFAGYCLTGDVTEHVIVFLLGIGANGKTTFLEALTRVMGDYACQAAPDLLMRRRDDPHPAGLADLQGARLALASETGEGRHLDEALVKRLTGGDRIKARQLYKDWFEFDPTHKFVVATNHRPEITGTDQGIWRRIRLIPFDVTIPADQQDRQLAAKLADESAGILAWAVQGCREWHERGLGEPAAVVAATADYRSDMDTLGEFLSDHCILAAGVNARAADLFERYTGWANETGETPMSQRKFGFKMRDLGLTKERRNGIWWAGIGLKAVEQGAKVP